MLGSAQTTNIEIQGGSIALSTAGAVAAPAIAAGIGISTAIAVPIIGAAVAGITLAVMYLAQGCGATCTMTSNFVDQVEPLMRQNVAAWNGSGKSCAEQQACISNFNILWGKVVEYCSNSQFGNAGKNCIGDRQRGGKWDWFSYYLDPIQNDKCSDLTVENGISQAIFGDSPVISGVDNTTLLAVAGLVIGGLFLATSN